MATAAQLFFLHKGFNKNFWGNVCFGIKKSHGIKKYITCILVLSKSVLENPWTDFHNFFCSIGNRIFRNIFNFVFEKSEKSHNSWNKRSKNYDYERYDHFAQDIEHPILNTFPDNLSLILNLFINLCKSKKSWAAVARYPILYDEFDHTWFVLHM